MLDTTLAARYANALYGAAKKQNNIAVVLEEIDSFINVMKQDEQLNQFFMHPAISPAEKKQLLSELLGNRMSKLCLTFLSILLDAKRMNYLGLVHETMVELFNHEQNKVKACIASVLPLDLKMQEKIQERVARYLHKEVELEFTADPDLLGGIKLTIEDKVIDGTVLHNLKKMENKIELG
jgi:F-type H+-transporting ATPase subunit delta